MDEGKSKTIAGSNFDEEIEPLSEKAKRQVLETFRSFMAKGETEFIMSLE
ncbi:MAG: hypothetical protein H0V31_02575 [Acidobacteria bacterium]|nr:hypothetical protein [Acidobacteriota bacterium]